MKNIILSLTQKALFALVAILLPVVVTFLLGYQESKKHLREHILNDLTALSEAYEGQVYQFLEMSKRRVTDFSSDGVIREGLIKIVNGERAAVNALNDHLARNKKPLDHTVNCICIISQEGRIVASTDGSMIGSDLSGDESFLKGKVGPNILERFATDFSKHELAASAPITDMHTGEPIGVIVNFIKLSELSKILSGESAREFGAVSWSKGRKKTMDLYLVNREGLMITESRQIKDAVLRQRVDTDPVKECLGSRKEVVGFYRDHRGVEVAGASMCFPEMRWTLLTEVESDEILAPVASMRKNAVMTGTLVAGLIGALSLLFFRNVARPLKRLSFSAEDMARGNYDVTIPVQSNDEIGVLTDSFNKMAAGIKEREEALRRKEKSLANSQHIAHLGSWEWDMRTNGLHWSDEIYRIFGLAPQEFGATYEAFLRYVHPDDRDMVKNAVNEAQYNGKTYSIDHRIVRPDGTERIVHEQAVITFDGAGKSVRMEGTVQDITEFRRTVDQLHLLQTLSLAINEAADPHSALKVAISKVCEATGWRYGEAWLPRRDGTALEFGIWCGNGNGMGEFVEHSKRFTFPPNTGLPGRVWSSRKPEWVRDVSVNGKVFLRAGGAMEAGLKAGLGVPIIAGEEVLAVLVFYMDETSEEDKRLVDLVSAVSAQLGSVVQRKLAEEARFKMKQRYEELVNDITVGIFRSAESGDFIEVNRSAISMLGADSREELLSHNLGGFFPDEDKYRGFSDKMLKNGFFKEEVELRTLTGKKFWAAVSVVSKRDQEGNLYFDGVIEDVTERKKLEEQLRHSQKLEAVGQLAGGMAHDFNNILTAIIGYGNLLLTKRGKDDLIRDYADNIITSAERAAHLTQGLLTFSRRQVINPHVVDLNELIKRFEKLLLRLISEDIEIKTNFTDRSLTANVDPMQIEQVLMNLATNARDAMPDGGILTISTEHVDLDNEFVKAHGYGEQGRYAMISFSDTGVGMDEATRGRIFEPFFTTKEVGKGTGLGLSIAYGIIKQHNGYINVYGEPGKGTTFRIYLPATGMLPEERVPQVPKSSRGGSETILLAEDEPVVRRIIKTVLEEAGYKVVEAVNGEDAVNRFVENREGIDLLICDMVMPKKGGKEAYDEIRKIRPDVKVLFMSGYTPDMMKTKGILDEGLGFITKPIYPTEFLIKVREVIENEH